MFFQMMLEFFKTGLFAVGGGLATLPFLQEIGARTGWFTNAELANMIAISESTPGPIGVNMSTYVGFHLFHLPGALIATLSLIAPSVLVILLISRFLEHFKDNPLVNHAFYGLRAASTGLIAAACIGVVRIVLLKEEAFLQTGKISDLIDVKSLLLLLVLLAFTNLKALKKLHPAVFLAASALIGILFSFGA